MPLGRDLALMLDAGSRCAAALGKRVLFLSDITLWLADIGLSWECIGVDFPAAQDELEQQRIGMYLSLSQRAHAILCPTARTLTIYYASGGRAEVPPEDRELVRASFEVALDPDWPGCVSRRWRPHSQLHESTLTCSCASSSIGARSKRICLLSGRYVIAYLCVGLHAVGDRGDHQFSLSPGDEHAERVQIVAYAKR